MSTNVNRASDDNMRSQQQQQQHRDLGGAEAAYDELQKKAARGPSYTGMMAAVAIFTICAAFVRYYPEESAKDVAARRQVESQRRRQMPGEARKKHGGTGNRLQHEPVIPGEPGRQSPMVANNNKGGNRPLSSSSSPPGRITTGAGRPSGSTTLSTSRPNTNSTGPSSSATPQPPSTKSNVKQQHVAAPAAKPIKPAVPEPPVVVPLPPLDESIDNFIELANENGGSISCCDLKAWEQLSAQYIQQGPMSKTELNNYATSRIKDGVSMFSLWNLKSSFQEAYDEQQGCIICPHTP